MIKNDLSTNPDYASFIYFDLETNPQGQVIDVGVYSQGYQVMSFDEFISYILSLRDATLVAHNGANFDFLFIVSPLIENGYVLNYGVSGSSGISLFAEKKVDKKTFRLRFIDSYRVTVSSLKNLGSVLGTDNKKVDIDMLPHELKVLDPELYYHYLRQDVFSLKDGYLTFMKQFNGYYLGKNPPLTAASLSLKIFKNHLEHTILVSTKKTREFERQSYFGGICYCEKPQSLEVNVYDINSMYPFIMGTTAFPISYVGHYTDDYQTDTVSLWKVKISEDYPGIPFTFDIYSRSLQKTGDFILDSETIDYIRSLSVSVHVEFGYIYLKTDFIFAYYRELYANRLLSQKNGDFANAYALKIVLNSLYGKFGQRDERKIITGYDESLVKTLIDSNQEFKTNESFIFYTESEFQKTAFPAISSFVTLRARLLIRRYSDRFESVVYCDTDSLHVPISETIETTSEWGGFKLEYSGNAVYLGKKLYCLTDAGKLVHKGLPKNTLTIDDFIGMLDGDRFTREFNSFPTVRDVLELGKQPGVLISKHRTVGIVQ